MTNYDERILKNVIFNYFGKTIKLILCFQIFKDIHNLYLEHYLNPFTQNKEEISEYYLTKLDTITSFY